MNSKWHGFWARISCYKKIFPNFNQYWLITSQGGRFFPYLLFLFISEKKLACKAVVLELGKKYSDGEKLWYYCIKYRSSGNVPPVTYVWFLPPGTLRRSRQIKQIGQ